MSFSTFPGPTLGSWSTSPTRISFVPIETALRSEFIILMSTIDISSTIITSASSGLSSFLSKNIDRPAAADFLSPSGTPPLISNILWIVCASYPQASVILLAARPVGAASLISRPSSSKYLIIVLIVVVLPVPGPPVTITSPFLTAFATASFWISSRVIPSLSSILAILSSMNFWSSSIWTSRLLSIAATFASML